MFNALRRILSYLLLLVIVMTAFTSLMLRLLTPMLGEYRTDIEQWASQLIQQPIAIQSIEAKMVGFTPQLNLAGVEFLDANRQSSVARFEGLSIHFGMLSSLINGTLTLDHIELHGLDISLVKDNSGNISVSGLGGATNSIKSKSHAAKTTKLANDSTPQVDDTKQVRRGVEAWLLQQGKVSIHRSRIRWHDVAKKQKFDFPEVSVILTNDGKHHSIYSLLELPDEVGSELELDIDLAGDIFNKQSWHGNIYLRGDELNGQTLLGASLPKEWQVKQGHIDGEFWGEIANGKLEQLQGRVAARKFELAFKDRKIPLSNFDLQGLLSGDDTNWKLQFSRINFDGPLRGKVPHYLQLQQEDAGWRLNFDQLNLAALLPFVSVIKPELLDDKASFGGYLNTVEVHYGERVDSFAGTLDGVKLTGVVGFPTVVGLEGDIALKDGVTTLAVNSPGLKLNIPRIFKSELPPLAVKGALSATWDQQRWQLWSHQLQLTNDDIDLNVAANLQSRLGQAPHIAIAADIDVAKIKQLKHYVPDNVLGKKSAGWLKDAFHSGAAHDGQLLIVGSGGDIVNRAKGGRMEIVLSPTEVDLQFHKKWPKINNIDADLRFSARKMTINANKGELLSTGQVQEVVVEIADFKKPRLTVDGLANFGAADGIEYISKSPLEEILGKVGDSVTGKGEQQLKLKLGIPLDNGNGQETAISGKLDFNKVALNIEQSVEIQEISGTLSFNQHGVKRSKLDAQIFKHPLKLSIYKRRKGTKESTLISTQSKLSLVRLHEVIDMPWVKQITGQTRWKGIVEFDHSRNSGELSISSDLKGAISKLPHPLNKKSGESLPFVTKYRFTDRTRRSADISIGKRLSAQLRLPKSGEGVKDIHIHLGSGKLKRTKHSGLLFTGRLSQLNVGRWLELLSGNGSGQGKAKFELPIRIAMQRLHILNKKEKEAKQVKRIGKLSPSSIPPLQVEINAIKYGSLQLGGITLVTQKAKNGLAIKKLVVSDGNHRLRATGSWKRRSGTTVELKLTAKDMGKMLKTLQFDTPMEKGELTAEGKLRWPNSPMDFELAKVGGNFKMQANEGVIKDVSTDAGQLLGLLNVGKIFNRIFLDFSDVQEKDLNYKHMIGNFKISRGSIHTDNYFLRSTQADLRLTGRIGLVKQDFDNHLSVIPQISDAVPVAGLIFGPQVAVALQALNRLFGKEIDKGAMQRFRVTGSWDNPNIKKLKPKQAELTDE